MGQIKASGVIVLMAVYERDDPAHFRAALHAITERQSLPPARVLVVADGALPEGLREALASHRAECPISTDVLFLPANVGLSNALRAGAERLNGRCRYILRTDADDISRPERIAEQVAYMEAHPEVGVASAQVSIFESAPERPVGQRRLPAGLDLAAYARRRTPINHSASIFRAEALASVPFPETRLPFEDWWISLRLIRAGWAIGVIDAVHLDFRGGRAMIARRSGLGYALKEVAFFRQILREGLMTLPEVAANLAQRLPLRLLPGPLMQELYARRLHR
ncbi:glycosyltransferase [Pseudoroseicyclus sp. CXY001]|uniref:glycosyltransferase n=1 Tax=Pseudoroseicyclus sp. CXY001 TaxID=3242492 RepID=UPI00358DBC75